jgi:hypothetical protein
MFGDRHHRPDPGGKLRSAPRLRKARVQLRVSGALADTRVGQLGAWLCVNLLSRLEGLVATIELEVPPVATHATLHLLGPISSPRHRHLAETLTALCSAVSAGAVDIVSGPQDTPSDVELILGGAEAEVEPGTGPRRVWCFGSGWRASTGTAPTVAVARIEDDTNPLGMYLAACYGVGEIFKHLKGARDDQDFTIVRLYASLWSGANAEGWDDLEEGPSVHHLRLPVTYLAGAGAVAQALLLAVATATAGIDYLTALDRDCIGDSNRNRYVLTLAEHARAQVNKAKLAVEFLSAFGISAYGQPLFWFSYIEHTQPHPDPDLRRQEADLKYRLVLSCVDRNSARQEIQRTWPQELLGASTESLRAEAVYYDRRTTTACLSCHNPVQPFEDVVKALREQLTELTRTQRQEHLQRLGITQDTIDSALRYLDDPQCGELGESVLRKFAEDGPPGFAVGFVSVAAGMLLARHWIRYALYGPQGVTPTDRHYLTMNFFNGRFLWREEAQSVECDCGTSGGERWRALWRPQ